MSSIDALVHIAAPTTKENDDRFLQQVLAYPGFLAAKRHNILQSASVSLQKSSALAVQSNHIQIGGSASSTSKRHRSVLRAARKRSDLHRHAADRAHLTHPAPSRTHQPLIACTKDTGRNLSNPSPGRLDSTQQLFDTQQAAAGIESQISTLSASEDTSPSYDGFARPPKRQRTSLDIQAHTDCQDPTIRPIVSPRSQSHFVTPPRAARSEAGRWSSPPACVVQREMTPSTALERRIQDFQNLREMRPDLFTNSQLGLDQFDAVISSILPDTYGLSKSNKSSPYGTPEEDTQEDSVMERCRRSGYVLSVQSESQRNASNAQPETRSQDLGDGRIVVAIEKRLVPHGTALAKDIIEPETESHERSIATMNLSRLTEIHSVLETTQSAGAESSLALTSDVSAHVQRSWLSQKLAREESSGSLRVPKSTKIPPALPSKPQRKSVPACILVGKLIRDDLTGLEELANTNGAANPVLNGLRAVPRQIFPFPEWLCLGAEARPELSAAAPEKPRMLVAEHHLLYRRTSHRMLHPMERGHWECKIASWEPSFQLEFLQELKDVVERGSLGLSPWVEVQHDYVGLPYQVHMYCSARESREIWLLLHLFSKKRFGQQESHWVDWQGKPAVTIPARSERDTPGSTTRDTRAR